jgi:acetyltransferase-like isoleucine patch superfamily enzyme
MTIVTFFRKASHIPRNIKRAWFWYIANVSRNGVVIFTGGFIDRSSIWRMTGCKVGKNVSIGLDVYYDVGNAKLITIEDDVWITSRALILCHRRDMKAYHANERYKDLSYILAPVVLKKGCCISMGAMIMPGVTVGEGAVVGAGAIVTKDVPAWTVVTGNPAKVLYEIKDL